MCCSGDDERHPRRRGRPQNPRTGVKEAEHDPLRARTYRFRAFSQFTEARNVLLTREATHAGRLDPGNDVLERLTLSILY